MIDNESECKVSSYTLFKSSPREEDLLKQCKKEWNELNSEIDRNFVAFLFVIGIQK